MAPSDVDYALQTLVSKIKERELESQRALSEHDVANRLLKLQLQELQKKLNEKESQLADANETIRALRSVTQIITGLQDEIRALRTQLRTSHAHKHRLVTTPKKNPATRSTSNTTQASDNLSCHTLHPTETGPTCSAYISQNSTQECTLLKLISDCGRTTDVAVPGVKQEEQEVVMDEGEGGGHEDRETEGQVPDESVKVENSEWDGGFENSHAESSPEAYSSAEEEEEAQTVHSAKQTVEILKGKILNLEGKVESLTEERNFLREGLEGALKLKAEVGEPSQQPSNQTISDISSDSAETSEFEPLPKKKKKDRRVRTPEDSILRYNKVLKLVKSGHTKTDAYIRMKVDRNTIVSQAPIAELAAVNPELFRVMRATFRRGDSLQRFASLCMAQCSLEPNAGLITVMKESNHLLDIGKIKGQ
ncbi:uncharacterized protein LOC143125950 isoform X2 [Alosa pseudoharengus]|uniref:uncharacterized protein LOC143125950 isoform X2 n=1 Tax=Alosa pseudoharengus TaxID=34774 RepID=UPI003F890EBE